MQVGILPHYVGVFNFAPGSHFSLTIEDALKALCLFAEMRKGCVADSIRTRSRRFLGSSEESDERCKKNGSTTGYVTARTDTLVDE